MGKLRMIAWAAGLMAAAITAAWAQSEPPLGPAATAAAAGETRAATAPARTISAAGPDDPCVTIEIGHEHQSDISCLNARLAAQTARQQQQNALQPLAPGPGTESVDALGIATPAAARERLGTSFGTGLPPQRPNRGTPTVPFALHAPASH